MVQYAAILTLLVLLAPLAAAAGSTDALQAPDLSSLSDAATSARDAVGKAGAAVGTAAGAVGAAFANAAGALADAASALGSAIAGAAAAIVDSFVVLGAGFFGFVQAHPKETAIATATTASAGGLWWGLRKFGGLLFLPLYTRLAPSQMLANEQRSRVYEHVRAHPGAHPSLIADTLHLGWGTVVYHLGRLEGSQLVVARAAHNRKCYFVVGSELDQDARTAVAAMAHDKARLIVDTVRLAPGITQKELSERVGMSQALASWHVKRLVESGVLLATRDGRSNRLAVATHVPLSVHAPVVASA